MTAKRFIYFKNPIGFGKQGIEDKQTNEVFDFTLDNVLDVMNKLSDENEQLKKEIEKITKAKENWAFISDCSVQVMNEEEKFKEDYLRIATNSLKKLQEENEQLKLQLQNTSDQRDEFHRGARENANRVGKLKKENEQLKKELHLMHMRTMFSTVQSFKGDVSKRYKYSKETDRIYDTANHYGQYDKVLDKKEIVMLLNEYETVLNELKGDVE